MVIPNWKVHSHALLTRLPLSIEASFYLPFDLHVLSMPPAFVLSQDQTLMFNPQYSWCKRTRHLILTVSRCVVLVLRLTNNATLNRSAACKPILSYVTKIVETSKKTIPPLSRQAVVSSSLHVVSYNQSLSPRQ